MDSGQRRDKRRTFLSAIGIVAAVMVLAPPVVQAATQRVNVVKSVVLTVKGSVSVKNLKGATTGNPVAPSDHASLPGEKSPVFVDTDNFAGGEGVWGIGTCEHPTAANRRVLVPAAAIGEPDNVISNVLVGSPDAALVTITAPDLPSGETPVLLFRTTAEVPSASIDLSSGLRVSPSSVRLECVSGGTLPTDPATMAVLGH